MAWEMFDFGINRRAARTNIPMPSVRYIKAMQTPDGSWRCSRAAGRR